MIDPLRDELLSLDRAARVLSGSLGEEVPVRRLRRWATRGVRGVTLESTVVGGRRFTTRSALRAFCDALSAGPGETPGEPQQRVLGRSRASGGPVRSDTDWDRVLS